jgi:SH3-like domain-containing protein
VLRRGTRLTVVAKGDHWYRVRLDNGTEGWVAESVVTSTPSD